MLCFDVTITLPVMAQAVNGEAVQTGSVTHKACIFATSATLAYYMVESAFPHAESISVAPHAMLVIVSEEV